MFHKICLTCHVYDSDHCRAKLLQYLNGLELKSECRMLSFKWNESVKCRYGLPCNKVDDIKQKHKDMERKLNKKLSEFVTSGNKEQLGQVLFHLRGEQPDVYRQVEREFYKNHKYKEKENG